MNFARWGGEHNRPGNDGGCFAAALAAVRRWGGVLEHPAFSDAWKAFALPRPKPGRWLAHDGVWVAEVWQSAYGHKANKRTWLAYCGQTRPPEMDWSRPEGTHQIGFHDQRGPDRNKPTISGKAASATPPAFRDVLLSIARSAVSTAEDDRPYVHHLEDVHERLLLTMPPEWDGVVADEARQIAWLHDVIEDTSYDMDDLRAEGFSETVYHEVGRWLTRHPKVSYTDYIDGIVGAPRRRQTSPTAAIMTRAWAALSITSAVPAGRARTRTLPRNWTATTRNTAVGTDPQPPSPLRQGHRVQPQNETRRSSQNDRRNPEKR